MHYISSVVADRTYLAIISSEVDSTLRITAQSDDRAQKLAKYLCIVQ